MARKVIAEKLKMAAAKRVIEGKESAADAGRRLGVTAQAVREWRREYEKANPASEKPTRQVPMSPAARPEMKIDEGEFRRLASEGTTPPPAEPPATGEGDGAPAVDAALAAEGVKPPADPPSTLPAAPAPDEDKGGDESEEKIPDIIDPDELAQMDDQAMVEMAGTLIMGASTRGALLLAGFRYKVELDWTDPKFENMFTLTEKEIRSLKPCFRLVGPKIRKWVGSSEFASLLFAGGVVSMGCADRYKAISAIVKKELRAQQAARTQGKTA